MTRPQDSDQNLEALLAQSEERFRALILDSDDGVVVLNAEGTVVFTNASAERLLGRSLAELMGEPFGVPVVAGDRAEIELRRAGGAHDVVELRAFASAWGGVPAILVWLRDLTERVEFERQLRAAAERYDLVVSGTRDGIWDWDLARGEVFYSAHWNELVGLPAADRTDSVDTWFARVHSDDVEMLREAIETHRGGGRDRVECEVRTKAEDQTWRWMLVRGVVGFVGGSERLAGSMTDVTARRNNENLLRFQSLHDPLTGLANRVRLLDELVRLGARLRRGSTAGLALVYLDLAGFKAVNDRLGHDAGDQVLAEVAKRIKAAVRPEDLVARLGGDEFVALLDMTTSPAAVAVASRIAHGIAWPIEIDGAEPVVVYASVGVRFATDPTLEPEQILSDADAAMYRAKRGGSQKIVLYGESDDERRTSGAFVELQLAMENGELELHYLPVVSLPGCEVVGVEALVRRRHPELGLLAARAVLDLADTSGQMPALDRWVVERAVWESDSLRSIGYEMAESVTVNALRSDLLDGRYIDVVTRLAREHRSMRIRLDVEERDLRLGDSRVHDALARLRMHGIALQVDGFGVGDVSIELMHELRPELVKIDPSLTAGVEDDALREVVRSIIAAAHSVDASVLAEGVEHSSQVEALVDLGCDLAQGTLFSPALPIATLARDAHL